ncbi:MAG: M1 family metallopeptidase [Rudaea sp.]
MTFIPMRYLILFLFLLLSACGAATATPPPAGSTPTVPRVTGQPAGPTASPSAPAAMASQPAATLQPGSESFAADLRPEFKNDISLVPGASTYRMSMQLSPALDSVTGSESVTFTNRTGSPLNEVYFRLFANYPETGGRIQVSGLRVDGASAQPVLEVQDTALKVPLAAPLAADRQVRLDLDFAITVPISTTGHYADFTNTDGILTLPTVYPLIPAHDAKGWHIELPPDYGDLVYSDSSFYDVTITAPLTTTVIASGSAVDTRENGSLKTWHYLAGPMRDFNIDASALFKRASTQLEDIQINSYFLAQDETVGQNVLRWATDSIAEYQKRIGPYPFKEFSAVETPTRAGGIEYPGVIVLPKQIYAQSRQSQTLEFNVAHEVGHQWWYSVVGDDQVNTPWMDEALTQYTAYIYEQDLHGSRAGDFVKQQVFQSRYDTAVKDGRDAPVGLPVSSYTDVQYSEIVYGKGPLFFDLVRKQMGDEKFFQFLQTYYHQYKYKVATPDDMLRVMEQVGGASVMPLYNQWILGK